MAISFKNNNPGAIMYAGWERQYGAVPGGKNVAGTLARFPTPEAGYAAAAAWHRRYEAKHGPATLNERMRAYAPPAGNGNSKASYHNYVAALAKEMGITPDTPFSISDPNLGPKLLAAHSKFEAGSATPFAPEALAPGYALGVKGADNPVGLPMADVAPSAGRTLRKGMSGPDVATLQTQLNDRGAGLWPDAKFGPATAAALRSYQSGAGGMPVDAIAGRRTNAALFGPDPGRLSDLRAPGGPLTASPSPAEYNFSQAGFTPPNSFMQPAAPASFLEAGARPDMQMNQITPNAPEVKYGGQGYQRYMADNRPNPLQTVEAGAFGLPSPQVAADSNSGQARGRFNMPVMPSPATNASYTPPAPAPSDMTGRFADAFVPGAQPVMHPGQSMAPLGNLAPLPSPPPVENPVARDHKGVSVVAPIIGSLLAGPLGGLVARALTHGSNATGAGKGSFAGPSSTGFHPFGGFFANMFSPQPSSSSSLSIGGGGGPSSYAQTYSMANGYDPFSYGSTGGFAPGTFSKK